MQSHQYVLTDWWFLFEQLKQQFVLDVCEIVIYRTVQQKQCNMNKAGIKQQMYFEVVECKDAQTALRSLNKCLPIILRIWDWAQCGYWLQERLDQHKVMQSKSVQEQEQFLYESCVVCLSMTNWSRYFSNKYELKVPLKANGDKVVITILKNARLYV